jgi:hypothetical protein
MSPGTAEPRFPLGDWVSPSGVHVAVSCRLKIELDLRDLPETPGRHQVLRTTEDRRWFLETVIPQLRGPLLAQLEGAITAAAVTWAAPDPGDQESP